MKRKPLWSSTALRGGMAALTLSAVTLDPVWQANAAASHDNDTRTPIKHIIVIIGENRSFDHVFATYKPKKGETVFNLLSEGIVKADGTPGTNYAKAAQNQASVTNHYNISPASQKPYKTLPPAMTDGAPTSASDTNPPPFATLAAVETTEAQIKDGLPKRDFHLLTTGATGLTNDSVDTRVPNATKLPNGPYQLSGGKLSYDSYTASPVHRFYQMWQQADCSASTITAENPSGCTSKLFPWVEATIGAGSNGNSQPANFTDQSTGEGATSMGFWNMQQGDAPYFKHLADTYSMSDNFHQSIMGGTGANHIAVGTGLAIYYTDGQGHMATPPSNEIENPNPQTGTNNYYIQDGYSGGSYSECANSNQPGVKEVTAYLASLPYTPSTRCQAHAYYLLNNYNPGYFGDGTVNTSTFTIPPSPVRTIGDTLNDADISWKYYGAGWNAYVANPNSDTGSIYCNICNPFLYETSIMTSAKQRKAHLADVPDLEADIKSGALPAVSIVKPDGLLDGHPASSKLNLFEAFTRKIVNEVQANPELWAHTAILITFDEGGGYWDSGYIQPLDFFGDGTRIPAIMVSSYSEGGRISHVYGDHVSFLKFVERNWRLRPVSENGRDNLPNPITKSSNPYAPVNSPAIGDLMDLFDFKK
ncbi:MAG TPA: alkaline phosphatase family protein [Rhodopila sp.]|uniref:alkaline phosphatase family protein n=1 Tax=Rhodopila sp. TaxID=2480087 RepID=UPI002C6E48A1|nr:alkaline phosphatase family protein [Rhodopila sp.]HVY15981.1 alkaline phosphatase family protein [Rhodopila sp.]